MGGKPLLGAEGWVLSLTLLPADLRGNKKGSERLAAVCLPVSGVGGGVFPHLHQCMHLPTLRSCLCAGLTVLGSLPLSWGYRQLSCLWTSGGQMHVTQSNVSKHLPSEYADE